jgi:CDP-paratose 2-epimerase
MEDLGVVERNGRYEYGDLPGGVPEDRPLDFHSPYGCSKGVADQYTIDYSRIYGLQTVTFRQSCIYGTRQFGIEDQGWVAWFTIASVLKKQITIYGDGKQIRDVLHVGDLVRAYQAAYEKRGQSSGQAFNIGGGPTNTLSLLELIAQLEHRLGEKIPLKWSEWRPGDQPVFVCDVAKAEQRLGWRPVISVREGVDELIAWTRDNRRLFDILAEREAVSAG